MKQKIIFECCGSIGHKAHACIIRGPKFLPPSLRRNMNKFNVIHGEEPNESPRWCNSQPPAAHLKYGTSPPNTRPVVTAIMRRNHNSIENSDVEFHPSEFLVEYNPEYVPDTDTTMIKSIDDD